MTHATSTFSRLIRAAALGAGAVAALGSLGLSPARAEEPTCMARPQILAQLAERYREQPVAMGLANNGGVIEVLRSGDRASFTIIITMPSGVSCMIAAGESWEDMPKALAKGPGI